MKLYLSSYRIPDRQAFFDLFEERPERLDGAILINAKDDKPAEERRQKLDVLQADLAAIGLKHTVLIDLLEFGDAERLGQRLEQFDYLYAAGGNVFCLRGAMKKSGFDAMIGQLLEANQVYVGESAGAVVVGPSLRGFESMDDANSDDGENWQGLGLVNTIIVPHNDSPDPRYTGRASSIEAANPGAEVLPLNDNQALVIDGDQHFIVSPN